MSQIPDAGASSALPASASPTLAQLADDYFAHYRGRDATRPQRIGWWVTRLGTRPAISITDDEIFIALEALAAMPARVYAGKDADGNRVFRARSDKRAGATLNRYQVALGALYSWAIKRRRLPKGSENPCRKVERQPERAGIVRFLSAAERERLLEACRVSQWPRLYAVVLIAITTGARRSEITGLYWRDLDLERACAYLHDTKNGDRRVLPLTPAVTEELAKFRGARDSRVFPARGKRDQPYHFEEAWRVAREQAKLTDFRFHDLRHTCASYLAQQGASILEIADVLGHRDLKMAKRYSHLTIQSKASLVNRVLGEIR